MNDDTQSPNPSQRSQSPLGPQSAPPPPSIDGVLRTTNQAAQPKHRGVLPLSEQARLTGGAPAPGSSVAPNAPVSEATDPAAPSSKRPFQPGSFYEAPKLPKLPVIDDTPRPALDTPEPRQNMRDAISILGVLASALLLAFCLIFFVFQSYQVDGQSMRTTLEDRDHLIIWKVPKTIANITGHQYVPHRGDVIIFNEPGNAEPGGRPGKQLIKRVTGLPGDRISWHGTDLVIYNKEYPNGFHPDKEMSYGSKIINTRPSNEELTVGPDEVFVNGDNRDNSLDSRSFGPLKTNLIVGKLVVRLLPLNTFKLF